MAKNHKLQKLNVARDYMANNYIDSLCLSAIAKHSNMSPYYFLRQFKSVYGETPNEFLIRLRIEKAKKMLITENLSVSEVCERSGYVSLGSFSSLFLKHVGMAPTLYRRRLWAMSSEAFHFPSQAIPACYAHYFLGK